MEEMVRRILFVAVLLALGLHAATVRLYLKDGNFHQVNEYKVTGDRVRYYSTERGDWEEIPLSLVDLKRTEAEIKERAQEREQQAKAIDEEDSAEREQRREIERIPYETGVFQVAGDKVEALKQAEAKAVTNKGRSILKAVSPIPVFAGKAVVEVEGPHATYVAQGQRPEFYFRLAAEERFGILRMKPTKNGRGAQVLNIIPVTKEIVEEMDSVEVFKKQLADGLYKLWPTKPLTPGEYAVYEYTEGKGNVQLWDFSVR